MKLHNIILKLYGLLGFLKTANAIEDDIEQGNITLSVTNEGTINRKITKDQTSCIKNNYVRIVLNSVYMLLIFGILSWIILASIIEAGIHQDGRFFTSNFFAIMYLVQYITGILFYKDKFNKIDKHKIVSLSYVISILVSLILAGSAIVFMINNLSINIYSYYYENSNGVGRIFLYIILGLNKFYSYGIYLINVITFVSTLFNQKSKIMNYKTKLERGINDSVDDTISIMIQEYSELQQNYKKTVNDLNNIFASITVFGLLGTYFTILNINTPFTDVFSYIDLALFVIIEGIYIYSINRIKNILADIKSLVGSPRFVIKYLGKSELVGINGDIYDDYLENDTNIPLTPIKKDTDDIIPISPSVIKLSPKKRVGTTPPPILITSLGANKEPVNPILPNTLRSTMVSRTFITPISDSPRTPITSRQNKDLLNIIYKSSKDDKNSQDPNKKMDMIKSIIFRNLIMTNENCINLDWMILYDKLSEPWECFHIFGFDIDDSQLIQQFISIVLGMLGLLRLNVKIGL